MSEQEKTIIDIESVADEVVKEYKWHINLSQDCIVTTEDKIRLWQINNIRDIRKIKDARAWMNPALILFTIVVTLVTSTFNKLLLKPELWEALFIVGGLVTICWLVMSLRKPKGKYKDEGEMLDGQIEELKKESRIEASS